MRRSVFFLTPLLPLALSACEDGPNQTFTPATGTLFNNGDTPAAVTDAGDPFNTTFGGGTLTQICAGNELQQQWNAMVQQPIAPVRYMAGVDLDNGPTYPLLSVDQTEVGPLFPIINSCVTEPTPAGFGFAPGSSPVSDPCQANTTQAACAGVWNSSKGKTNCGWNVIPALTNGEPSNLQSTPPAPTRLCQPTVLGPGGNGADVGGSIVSVWGNNEEFYMEWAVPTHKAYFLQLNPGYSGQMQWNYLTPSDGKMHYYDWELSLQIKKDGQPFNIGWSTGYGPGVTSQSYASDLDELYRGIASTYAPDVYDNAAPGVGCNDTGTCLVYPNAYDGTGRALFGMRPVSFYFYFNPPTLPYPSGDIVQSGYAFNIKYAPYSGSTYQLSMYTDGGDQTYSQPIADTFVGSIGPNGGPVECTFGMGNTFANLLKNCIDVFAVSAADKGTLKDPNVLAENKILGGLSHDDQNYSFYVVGINQNFRPVKLDVCTPALKAAGSNCGTDMQDVIHDTDTPLSDPANSLANEFYTDVRSFGAIQNDYSPPGSLAYTTFALPGAGGAPVACTAATSATACAGLVHPYTGVGESATCDVTTGDPNFGFCVQVAYAKDYHGSGAVWREYARLAQQDLNAQYVALHGGSASLIKSPHDTSCYFPQTCNTGVAADNTPSKCVNDSGTWEVAELMEAQPAASCTTNAQCTQSPNATCCLPTSTPPCPGGGTGLQVNTCVVPFEASQWRPAPGCTGIEGWVTSAEPVASPYASDNIPTAADDMWDTPAMTLNLGAGGLAPLYGIGGGFKPGDPQGIMCADPGYYNPASGGLQGFNFCGLAGDTQGLESDLLGAPATRVLQYMGNGNILQVPVEGRDRRYFFQQFAIAYAKYLTSNHVLDSGLAAKGATVLGRKVNGLQVGDFSTQPIDSDNFIFDSIGGGASRSEFVDFDSADVNNDPVDVEMKAIILSTNLQNVDYYRKLDREERGLFNSLAMDPTQASWGYLHNADGSYVTDNYLAGAGAVMDSGGIPSGNVNPGTPCTAATAAKVCGTMNPPATCNTNAAAGDPTAGLCVYAFSRHNANPFLTNIAGSPVPGSYGYYSGDLLGDLGYGVSNTPAPPGWADPCAPVSNPPAPCNPSDPLNGDSDCPDQVSLFGAYPTSLLACVPTGGSPTVGTCQAAMTPYYCATHADAANCAGDGIPYPPLNDDGTIITRANGKPILEGYCSLIDGLVSPYALSNLGGNQIQVLKTFPDEGEALVSLPVFQNPYFPDPTQNTNPIQVMVPWLPLQEGVGYPVAANGSQDVFVQTAQLDFTGQVITPTLDFLPVSATDPTNSNPQPPYGVQIMAWETQDFLGEVFLCLDTVTGADRTGTGRPGDVLTAHMYSSAETIVQWIGSHPNSSANCGLIVRYSPYDNYPDYISSLSNGVRLSIEAGAGYGRVIDATVFTPGTGAAVSP